MKRKSENKKSSFEFDTAADTPNLINVKRLDSFASKRNGGGGDQNNSPTLSVSTKTVSSKPPIDKPLRSYKLQTQKPAMQSWLYKQKQPSSSTPGNASSSGTTAMPPPIHSFNRPIKWKKYWCVLQKDYITFYKHIDDKIPKDFLLLKDFEIKDGSKKYGFVIIDNIKQVSHEFYAEQSDEYTEWNQALIDLCNRLNGIYFLSG